LEKAALIARIEDEIRLIETFTLSRREQISGVDARNARPLSADKRAELAPFLAANHQVIIDDASGLSRLKSQWLSGKRGTGVIERLWTILPLPRGGTCLAGSQSCVGVQALACSGGARFGWTR
jgi:hypothetical protein